MRRRMGNHQKFARSERVGEVIKRELAHYLMEGHLRLEASRELALTVTHVRISGDLRQARVFVRELGKAKCGTAVLELLNANSFRIKREIAHRLGLRYTPQLIFQEDEHLDESQRLYELIRESSPAEVEHA